MTVPYPTGWDAWRATLEETGIWFLKRFVSQLIDAQVIN